MRDAIAERRRRPSDDMLSLLIHAEDQGQVLDDEELVATSAFILLAGYETTTHLISNGLLALLEHPDQLRRLRDQPELVTSAVEEVLRYDSAVFQVVRQAREPVEIGGHVVQAGELVLGLVHAANRDPAQFADPERFDITRSNNNHLGFGYGPHFCVGAPIARLETGIALTTLVQRLPGLALATTSIERLPNLAIRGVRALPVTFTP
jgi:cytochrome P450